MRRSGNARRRHLLASVSHRVLVFMRPMHPARARYVVEAANAVYEKALAYRRDALPAVPKDMGQG